MDQAIERTHIQLRWFIRADPQRVFDAWTRVDKLDWFFNDSMPRPDEPIEVDLRPGGAWRQMMVIDDAKRYFTGGIYREIVPGKRLMFNWGAVDGWPKLSPDRLDQAPLVTLDFKPLDGGTELLLDMELPPDFIEADAREAMAKAMHHGWRMTVGRLVQLFPQ